MYTKTLASLAGASLAVLAFASAAHAQSKGSADLTTVADAPTLGEIVVTARRRSESLQEVPQTVNAVTADTLQKLNIERFEDVQTVAPGLNLQSGGAGYTAAAALRGVTFDVGSGAQPSVAMYMNDAPVQALFLFQSLFDIGQVEILKGPQGTTRGVSAPSGALTVTTHKPDLSEFGGYVDVTATDLGDRNVQGAINVPIIKDVLAVRAAAILDQSDYDGVTSLYSSVRPQQKTTGERISVSFEPTDAFNANVTYQHLDHWFDHFYQVTGPGPGVYTTAAGVFSGPPITPSDRLSVDDQPATVQQHMDVVTAKVDSRIFGQHLSYVGSYQHQNISLHDDYDTGNELPGIEILTDQVTTQVQTTQELRLASDPAPGRFFDYTVGAFYNWQQNSGTVLNPEIILPGAFGPSGNDLTAFNPSLMLPLDINIPSDLQETSLFGSVTFHLPFNTELSGGIRHIWSITRSETIATVGGATAFSTAAATSNTPNIYNVSLSHHFTRNFLAYANTGTAYRPPLTTIGLQGALADSSSPQLQALNYHPAERSRSYEIGIKSTWLDDRLRLNASAYRQSFSNLIVPLTGINYFSTTSNAVSSVGCCTASADALVQGFDVDTAFQVTSEWNVSAQMSYNDGRVQGTQVPCNLFDSSGKPYFNTVDPKTGTPVVSFCPGGTVSKLPLWNATIQSEYVHPLRDNLDGFLRVLATIYPQNKNRAEPDFTVPGYSLVNLYLGMRSHDGAWELSVFARNVLNAQVMTDVQQTPANIDGLLGLYPQLQHPTGYYVVEGMTNPREVGINVHYAFGSR